MTPGPVLPSSFGRALALSVAVPRAAIRYHPPRGTERLRSWKLARGPFTQTFSGASRFHLGLSS